MEPTILSNGENMYKTFSTDLFHLHFLCTLHCTSILTCT